MDFLQSFYWRDFQAKVGRKTFFIEKGKFLASIIEHQLPLVGKYFYLPRGPVFSSDGKETRAGLEKMIQLAQEKGIGWLRFEPKNEKELDLIRESGEYEIKKAPKNVQPREIFVIDLTKSEEGLLAEMKPKTRYNLKLAEKKGVLIREVTRGKTELAEFIRLTGVMARRNKIKSHPPEYYQKMLSSISSELLKLYVAEYQGKVIAANLVVFFEKTAIYLHGASDDEYRNVMAPFLLQWRQILAAKEQGCEKYDFGGVAVQVDNPAWQGITRFKTGFSASTQSRVFPGTFDLVLNKRKYGLYLLLQKVKRFL